jgi:hypothetical protein
MPDEPTKAELDEAEFNREVDIQNHEFLYEGDDWYRRAFDLIQENDSRRGWWIRDLLSDIERKCQDMLAEARPDTLDAMLDAMAYHKDIYAYHGVSRRDFM